MNNIKIIKDGEVVIFPTDTVYGMGSKLYDVKGVNKIYEIKSRSSTKELAVLFSSVNQIKKIAKLNEKAIKLANAFWPGALTIILNTNKEYYLEYNKKTIGVRIPNNKLALSLIELNGPLKTTSVNFSNELPLNNIEEIEKSFKDKVDYIYKEEFSDYLNLSSTVVDLTKEEIVILREGSIKEEDILNVLKDKE